MNHPATIAIAVERFTLLVQAYPMPIRMTLQMLITSNVDAIARMNLPVVSGSR